MDEDNTTQTPASTPAVAPPADAEVATVEAPEGQVELDASPSLSPGLRLEGNAQDEPDEVAAGMESVRETEMAPDKPEIAPEIALDMKNVPEVQEAETAHMEGNEPFAPVVVEAKTAHGELVVEPTPDGAEQPVEREVPASPSSTVTPGAEPHAEPEVVHSTALPTGFVAALFAKGRAMIQLRREKKFAKIMGLFARHTEIGNDDVEKLLHVSDATATRFLAELERRGAIVQNGKTGSGVTYTKR